MLNEIENWKDAPLWTPDKIEKVTENWFKFLKNKMHKELLDQFKHKLVNLSTQKNR